ncbi:MAG TPA: DUF4369 domain-containing protein, partial [Mucilaginibacter sp.]|nr:DUF4369 domain-containing protein [Mucilaginibacter sp.]
MMKFLLRFYLIFFLISNSASAQHFTLSGKLSKGRGVCLDLSYFNSKGKHTHDTCTLLNGTFSFKGEIQGPQIVYLTAYKGRFKLKSDDDPNVAAFFMEPGIITTKGGKYGDLKKIKISGSKTQTE